MWIDMLLGRKKPDEAVEGEGKASGAAIQYDSGLIPELKDEHQAALKVLEQVREAYRLGDIAATSAQLESFGSLLTAHLLKEDFRLYTYLEHALAGDPATRALVHQFREEMDSIGKSALSFFAKYRNIAATATIPEAFPTDLARLSRVLRERTDREETTLYPMYLPAY